VEVACSTNAVDLFVLIRSRARARDEVSDEEWVALVVPSVKGLSRAATLSPMMARWLLVAHQVSIGLR